MNKNNQRRLQAVRQMDIADDGVFIFFIILKKDIKNQRCLQALRQMDIADHSAPAVGVGPATLLTTRWGGGGFLAQDIRALGSSAGLQPHGVQGSGFMV
jgi:hypothetical protein